MAKTRKRRQKQSLKEFRAWLQGVEELQEENWSPSRDQWVLIRDKIDGIAEEKPAVVNQVVAPNNMQPQPARLPASITPPPPVGGLPNGQITPMSTEAQKMLNPGAGVKAKTPDIDTADGNVNSAFA